ncbi:MAG: hypothetical protein KC464_24490, partial [Myxococcales bacterium]|nr:hypothetical protein [Myxococcales bacterium]
MPRPALAAIAGIAVAGCHVQSRVATTRPGQARVERTDGAPRALPATIVLGDDGYLRFVTPLSCPADRLVEVEAYDTVRTEPNLAAFVVGVVVTAAG